MKAKSEVEERWVQVFPPSVDLNIPIPADAPGLYQFEPDSTQFPNLSPVPTYITSVSLGSYAIDETAKLAHVPSTKFQFWVFEVISLLYHKPPLTPAAQIFVELFGSNITALVLPPIVLGPRSSQSTSVILLRNA